MGCFVSHRAIPALCGLFLVTSPFISGLEALVFRSCGSLVLVMSTLISLWRRQCKTKLNGQSQSIQSRHRYGRMELNSAIQHKLVPRLICIYYIYVLSIIYCLLIALDEHMFIHNGYGPGPRTRAEKLLDRGLGARSFWALVLGPGPI